MDEWPAPDGRSEAATIVAGGDSVVIAGGERIGVLDAADGTLRWTASVAELGKSRGYALPGAVQHVDGRRRARLPVNRRTLT